MWGRRAPLYCSWTPLLLNVHSRYFSLAPAGGGLHRWGSPVGRGLQLRGASRGDWVPALAFCRPSACNAWVRSSLLPKLRMGSPLYYHRWVRGVVGGSAFAGEMPVGLSVGVLRGHGVHRRGAYRSIATAGWFSGKGPKGVLSLLFSGERVGGRRVLSTLVSVEAPGEVCGAPPPSRTDGGLCPQHRTRGIEPLPFWPKQNALPLSQVREALHCR